MSMSTIPRDVRPGQDVYSADEHHVGKIIAVNTEFMTVEKGLIFHTDRNIPIDAVKKIADDRIYLNMTKDAVSSRSWDPDSVDPPHDASGTATYAAEREATGQASPASLGTTGYMGESATSPGLGGDLMDGDVPMNNGRF